MGWGRYGLGSTGNSGSPVTDDRPPGSPTSSSRLRPAGGAALTTESCSLPSPAGSGLGGVFAGASAAARRVVRPPSVRLHGRAWHAAGQVGGVGVLRPPPRFGIGAFPKGASLASLQAKAPSRPADPGLAGGKGCRVFGSPPRPKPKEGREARQAGPARSRICSSPE